MTDQWAGALAAEEAAIYAYGPIGVKLPGEGCLIFTVGGTSARLSTKLDDAKCSYRLSAFIYT